MYDVEEVIANHEKRIKTLEAIHTWGIGLIFLGLAAYGAYRLYNKK